MIPFLSISLINIPYLLILNTLEKQTVETIEIKNSLCFY
ncbi:MAG: hypothetical protein JETT_0491 [Candidatus Jettenia ecosi]|uniref:Uncharacterized protein n=1 Tax=Candidatus Jettenia ecosi TaxID=2494326 RepID=A0A533QEI9_9BACT|nr:MAG: hypothetical protein JETT_0491 [Candidatus Jettenia ecosi]